jgi:hypothetical protein
MTTFFNLPSNILTEIYEMDSTYREKIKKEINKEIYTKSFDIFRKNYIKNNLIDIEKTDFLLKFVFDTYLSQYEYPIFTDELFIVSEDDGYLRVSLNGTHNQPNDHDIFEGYVYTIHEYKIIFNQPETDMKKIRFLDILAQNDKFVIGYPYDNNFDGFDLDEEYDQEDDHFEFKYDHFNEI